MVTLLAYSGRSTDPTIRRWQGTQVPTQCAHGPTASRPTSTAWQPARRRCVIRRGEKVLIHSDNSPRDDPGVAGMRDRRCDRRPRTPSRSPAIALLLRKKARLSVWPHHATAVRHDGREAAATMRWIAVTDTDGGVPGTTGGRAPAFRTFAADAEQRPGRPIEPMLPPASCSASGTTSRPKAVVHTHANAVWAARTGPGNIDPARTIVT